MEIPENLRDLVEQLGQSFIRAIAEDPENRALAHRIHDEGFDVALLIEVTLALQHRRAMEEREAEESTVSQTETDMWSEEDRVFLKRFNISLD